MTLHSVNICMFLHQMEQFLVEDLQDVMKLDGLTTSHPVYVPVGHPDEINEIFDRISYAKVKHFIFIDTV